MTLPAFRYHPDPLQSGSVVASEAKCKCCRKQRGFIYTSSTYAEKDLEQALCPWCIADGSAAEKYDATFVDSEAFADGIPDAAIEEISTRTPGFDSWQGEQWPACCNDATAFLEPAGIDDIRARYRELEFQILNHIIHDMHISGAAATRLLDSVSRNNGPTAFVFRCLHCEQLHFYVDEG